MALSRIKKKLKSISLLLCILSLLLVILSQSVSWVAFEVNTSISGIASADINLTADFYQAKVEYEARASVAAGGIGGGIIGGFADLGGIGEGGNVTIPKETIYYYEGMGRFQDLVGAVYGTTKDADYWVNPKTRNCNDTKVTVNTHTDLIPWWPEGLAQEITITITLNETDTNFKHVRINEVWLEIYTDWSKNDREYQNSLEEVWRIEPGDYLYNLNDTVEYKHGVTLYREWGDRLGIIAYVNITLTDINDNTDYIQRRPYPQSKHPLEMVNIIPITQGRVFSVILMVLSFPISIIAGIIAIIAMILIIFDKRLKMHTLLAAAILEWFAVIAFVTGANTLMGLVEFVKPEWVTWNALGLLIPTLAGALLFVAFLLEFIFRPKEEVEEEEEEEEIKFDIGAAIAEEEEGVEEDEGEEEAEEEGKEAEEEDEEEGEDVVEEEEVEEEEKQRRKRVRRRKQKR